MPMKPSEEVALPLDALSDAEAASNVAETIDISTQLDRVITALLKVGTANPVEELQKLDSLYAESGPSAGAFVDTIARRLFQQSGVFDNLNFQSSLLAGGSSFFGAVIRRMGELADAEPLLAETAKLPVQIRLVEHYRRSGKGDEMRKYAEQVTAELKARVEANDKLALGQQAKVEYERSMHAFNEGKFEEAIAIGEQSIELCERAEDLYGVLAARGNTSGLFRYSWAKALGAGHADYTE
ncbi:MAG: hypothetical protein Greene101449_1199, partial [Candidatus Peregrinibacteria bacterium Greene1014_49]